MPPKDAKQPSDVQRRVLVNVLTQEIERAIEQKQSTAGRPVLRRLNRTEYQNTMRDLLDIDYDYSANLPPDSVSIDGFKNNGRSLQMSALQLEYYLDAARMGLSKAIVTGDAPEVFRHSLTEGKENGGRTVQAFDVSNTLGRTSIFLARIAEDYPESGEFVIRVHARAILAEGQGYPQLEIALGFRADTQLPHKVVGTMDIRGEQMDVYEFRGRIENFPLPSRTQSKFPGLLLKLMNRYTDGSPLPKKVPAAPSTSKGKKKKQRKQKLVWPDEPDMPKLQIESVDFIGPVFSTWPPKHHTDILFPSAVRDTDERGYARLVLRRFMQRAFRRPVADSEVNHILEFFDTVRERSSSFEESIRETLAMVLISPEFLYLTEPSGETKRPLNQWEIASRLSYFLWSTTPDQNLFEQARQGTLRDDRTLKRIAKGMLEDPRSWEFIEQFVNQWLDAGAVDRVAVNPEFYPDWDDSLKPSIRDEPKHFFAEILHRKLSALNFLDSKFAMLNAPLARHYGIPGPRGSSFERVSVEDHAPRGGLLSQASTLVGNSTGEDSHPVKRAVWIRTRLLNDPPAAPPPNVPTLDTENPNFTKLSVREQLESHRGQASCNDCHRDIDPWGIALERFGADGLLRHERMEPIPKRNRSNARLQPTIEDKKTESVRIAQSMTELPDGTKVDGLEELKAYLVSTKNEQFARALVHKLLSYALGRSLEFTDQPTIENLTSDFIAHDYQLHHLVLEVVASESFLTK